MIEFRRLESHLRDLVEAGKTLVVSRVATASRNLTRRDSRRRIADWCARRAGARRNPMPLYEYQCQDCNNHFERIEKVSSPTDGVCPSCGSAARRLLGAPALQFKGSGWYVTDYGKGNGGTPASQAEAKHESKKTSPETESSSKDRDHERQNRVGRSARKAP